jgi:hypothetical protein
LLFICYCGCIAAILPPEILPENAMARNSSHEDALNQASKNSPTRDGDEKEEHGHELGPVGFWDKDLKHVRGEASKEWGITSE